MNRQSTSTGLSKLGAVAILLLLLLAGWQLLLAPYINLWQERADEIHFLEQKMSRLEFLLEDGEDIDEKFRHLSENKSLNALFLSDKSGALADAKFQRIVRQMITQSGAQAVQLLVEKKPEQEQASGSPAAEGLESVTLRIVMRGDIKSIYTTLHKMENSRPLILVGNLEITHNQTRYQIARTTQKTVYRASYDATAFIL